MRLPPQKYWPSMKIATCLRWIQFNIVNWLSDNENHSFCTTFTYQGAECGVASVPPTMRLWVVLAWPQNPIKMHKRIRKIKHLVSEKRWRQFLHTAGIDSWGTFDWNSPWFTAGSTRVQDRAGLVLGQVPLGLNESISNVRLKWWNHECFLMTNLSHGDNDNQKKSEDLHVDKIESVKTRITNSNSIGSYILLVYRWTLG